MTIKARAHRDGCPCQRCEWIDDAYERGRADERQRIVAMLKERALWEYNDSPKVAHALKYAAYLIESETS